MKNLKLTEMDKIGIMDYRIEIKRVLDYWVNNMKLNKVDESILAMQLESIYMKGESNGMRYALNIIKDFK